MLKDSPAPGATRPRPVGPLPRVRRKLTQPAGPESGVGDRTSTIRHKLSQPAGPESGVGDRGRMAPSDTSCPSPQAPNAVWETGVGWPHRTQAAPARRPRKRRRRQGSDGPIDTSCPSPKAPKAAWETGVRWSMSKPASPQAPRMRRGADLQFPWLGHATPSESVFAIEQACPPTLAASGGATTRPDSKIQQAAMSDRTTGKP